jgi:predicted RNA-binding protein YlqC (UPF0109 family)
MVKELVEYIVRQIAHDADQVIVSVRQDEAAHIVEIKVADRDRGRLIGKRGRTIRALRLLLGVLAPAGQKVLVNIAE